MPTATHAVKPGFQGLRRNASQAEQTVSQYAMRCPVYRSVHKAIAITTELDFEAINPA